MLGSLILYHKGMRIMMFQLSGFYYIAVPANSSCAAKALGKNIPTQTAGGSSTVLLRSLKSDLRSRDAGLEL